MINEPTAAAVAYLHDSWEDGLKLVFDLGGGTLDISLLSATEEETLRRVVVKSTSGDTSLGGNNFRDVLVALFATQIKKQRTEIDYDELRHLCESVKESIQGTDRNISITYRGNEYRIGMKAYENACRPLYNRIEAAINAVMPKEKAVIPKEKDVLPTLIFVGGATDLAGLKDRVVKMLAKFGEVPVMQTKRKSQAVAQGAAIIIGNKANLVVMDCLPRTLGIEATRNGEEGVMAPLLRKDSPIPIETIDCAATLFKALHETSHFSLFEGEHDMVSKNHYLNQFKIDAPVGTEYQVQVAVDHNWKIDLTARAIDLPAAKGQVVVENKPQLTAQKLNELKRTSQSLFLSSTVPKRPVGAASHLPKKRGKPTRRFTHKKRSRPAGQHIGLLEAGPGDTEDVQGDTDGEAPDAAVGSWPLKPEGLLPRSVDRLLARPLN